MNMYKIIELFENKYDDVEYVIDEIFYDKNNDVVYVDIDENDYDYYIENYDYDYEIVIDYLTLIKSYDDVEFENDIKNIHENNEIEFIYDDDYNELIIRNKY